MRGIGMLTQAILLAAGESSRMGKPKAMLDWFGESLLSYQIDTLLNGGCDSVVVVTGASALLMQPILDEMTSVKAVHNPQHRTGKASSVRIGADAIERECDAIVLLAVDQPRPAWVVKHVLDSHYGKDAVITSPRHCGHGGHPLVFSRELKGALQSVTEAGQGVREIMSVHADSVNKVHFETPIVRIDINTPQDYSDALSEYPHLADVERM